MKEYIAKRVVELAEYIVDKKATVREAAKVFDVSKSTVHKDISERLPQVDNALYLLARAVLWENLSERHIRGGIATKEKYSSLSFKHF